MSEFYYDSLPPMGTEDTSSLTSAVEAATADTAGNKNTNNNKNNSGSSSVSNGCGGGSGNGFGTSLLADSTMTTMSGGDEATPSLELMDMPKLLSEIVKPPTPPPEPRDGNMNGHLTATTIATAMSNGNSGTGGLGVWSSSANSATSNSSVAANGVCRSPSLSSLQQSLINEIKTKHQATTTTTTTTTMTTTTTASSDGSAPECCSPVDLLSDGRGGDGGGVTNSLTSGPNANIGSARNRSITTPTTSSSSSSSSVDQIMSLCRDSASSSPSVVAADAGGITEITNIHQRIDDLRSPPPPPPPPLPLQENGGGDDEDEGDEDEDEDRERPLIVHIETKNSSSSSPGAVEAAAAAAKTTTTAATAKSLEATTAATTTTASSAKRAPASGAGEGSLSSSSSVVLSSASSSADGPRYMTTSTAAVGGAAAVAVPAKTEQRCRSGSGESTVQQHSAGSSPRAAAVAACIGTFAAGTVVNGTAAAATANGGGGVDGGVGGGGGGINVPVPVRVAQAVEQQQQQQQQRATLLQSRQQQQKQQQGQQQQNSCATISGRKSVDLKNAVNLGSLDSTYKCINNNNNNNNNKNSNNNNTINNNRHNDNNNESHRTITATSSCTMAVLNEVASVTNGDMVLPRQDMADRHGNPVLDRALPVVTTAQEANGQCGFNNSNSNSTITDHKAVGNHLIATTASDADSNNSDTPSTSPSSSFQHSGTGSTMEDLEGLNLNLASIKSHFEQRENSNHEAVKGQPAIDRGALSRSELLRKRLERYQSVVAGEAKADSSDEEDADGERSHVDYCSIKKIEASREIGELKAQWESGRVNNDLDQDEDAAMVVKEEQAERLEAARSEKEDDLSVCQDPVIAQRAKLMFRKIDQEIASRPAQGHAPGLASCTTKMSSENRWSRTTSLHEVSKDVDVVHAGEPGHREPIEIETAALSERYKFFENYNEEAASVKKKKFQMTPPRELDNRERDNASPPAACERDPNVVVGSITTDDIPNVDTATKMRQKFETLCQSGANSTSTGTQQAPKPRPLKRSTSSVQQEGLASQVTPSYHTSDPESLPADNITRNMRAMFEANAVAQNGAASVREQPSGGCERNITPKVNRFVNATDVSY